MQWYEYTIKVTKISRKNTSVNVLKGTKIGKMKPQTSSRQGTEEEGDHSLAVHLRFWASRTATTSGVRFRRENRLLEVKTAVANFPRSSCIRSMALAHAMWKSSFSAWSHTRWCSSTWRTLAPSLSASIEGRT